MEAGAKNETIFLQTHLQLRMKRQSNHCHTDAVGLLKMWGRRFTCTHICGHHMHILTYIYNNVRIELNSEKEENQMKNCIISTLFKFSSLFGANGSVLARTFSFQIENKLNDTKSQGKYRYIGKINTKEKLEAGQAKLCMFILTNHSVRVLQCLRIE